MFLGVESGTVDLTLPYISPVSTKYSMYLSCPIYSYINILICDAEVRPKTITPSH